MDKNDLISKPIHTLALETLQQLNGGDRLECEWQQGHTVFKFSVSKEHKSIKEDEK